MNEEIDFDDIEFGKPIEEREPNYRDGYIQGIYRARNIIDSKQKEIERLNNKLELISTIVEREFPPNEFITYKIKKILKGVDKE